MNSNENNNFEDPLERKSEQNDSIENDPKVNGPIENATQQQPGMETINAQAFPYEYPNQSADYSQPKPYQSQNPNQPQQTQWEFNEVGTQGKKSEKKKKNKGLKTFAIIMTVLCVLSLATLGGVLIYDQYLPNTKTLDNDNADKPSLDIKNPPTIGENSQDDGTGRLTTPAINKIVNPSVVAIVTYTKSTGYQVLGEGSGVIMSEDGYIVTNAHVVQSEDKRYSVDKIEVILDDKKTYTAKLVGADTKTDLAVIKIDATGLAAATFGDSEKLEVGETVIVIGNPSGVSFAGSLTQGVVSALNRQVQISSTDQSMRYIQTDAAINPGNSGGALVNQYAQVIGINSAKIVQEGYEGMGFAIPINTAKPIVDSMIENGYVKGRVRIGITYTPISQTLAELNGVPKGLRVVDFDPAADIAKKGIQKGDIITNIAGKEVYDAGTITDALAGKKPGETVKVDVYRVDGQGKANKITLDVILGEDVPTTAQ